MKTRHSELRTDWALAIETDAVLRALGTDPKQIRSRRPQFVRLVDRIVAEHIELLRPAVVMRTNEVKCASRERTLLEDGTEWRVEVVCQGLLGAESVAAIVATVGDEFMARASKSDSARRMIVDGLGTAAITALEDAVLRDVRTSARQMGRRITNPLYPGMKGWELAPGQEEIFGLVDARAAGVSLNQSFMMIPVKSVSFLLGIGLGEPEKPTACERCEAAANCQYKRTTAESKRAHCSAKPAVGQERG